MEHRSGRSGAAATAVDDVLLELPAHVLPDTLVTACHKLDGANAVGPHLDGVVGRPVGSVEGFSYSDAMAGHGEDPMTDPAGRELGHRVVRPLWLELQEETMQRLDALTLDELCARAHRAGVEGRVAQAGDFEI